MWSLSAASHLGNRRHVWLPAALAGAQHGRHHALLEALGARLREGAAQAVVVVGDGGHLRLEQRHLALAVADQAEGAALRQHCQQPVADGVGVARLVDDVGRQRGHRKAERGCGAGQVAPPTGAQLALELLVQKHHARLYVAAEDEREQGGLARKRALHSRHTIHANAEVAVAAVGQLAQRRGDVERGGGDGGGLQGGAPLRGRGPGGVVVPYRHLRGVGPRHHVVVGVVPASEALDALVPFDAE
mmetsp:Transcript_30737/g.77596  ORF Transcript_30737/g.77596 Transcript_30737/m.77596 type:complete len:245 (+) Transcript_30737:167-901(+)